MRRTYEEMKYFKLELQNREVNFNQTFGSQPRVGVMAPTAKGQGATQKLQSAIGGVAAASPAAQDGAVVHLHAE